MKLLKFSMTFLIALFIYSAINAQITPIKKQVSVLDGAYAREHNVERTPVPLAHINEEDALYSKNILRVLELTEKINHPLYFPINKIIYPGGYDQPQRSRVNLLYLIFNIGILGTQFDVTSGLELDEINYSNRYRVFKLNGRDVTCWWKDEIAEDDPERENLLSYVARFPAVDPETGESIETTGNAVLENTSVMTQLWMWEEWVFDKKRSVLDVRIKALAPDGWLDDQRIWPFWIHFDDYRPLFAAYEVFNTQNDAERRTFDDIFLNRRFKSYIVAESNNYDNRLIADYLLGIDAIREGERIQDKLMKYESDLWEF